MTDYLKAGRAAQAEAEFIRRLVSQGRGWGFAYKTREKNTFRSRSLRHFSCGTPGCCQGHWKHDRLFGGRGEKSRGTVEGQGGGLLLPVNRSRARGSDAGVTEDGTEQSRLP